MVQACAQDGRAVVRDRLVARVQAERGHPLGALVAWVARRGAEPEVARASARRAEHLAQQASCGLDHGRVEAREHLHEHVHGAVAQRKRPWCGDLALDRGGERQQGVVAKVAPSRKHVLQVRLGRGLELLLEHGEDMVAGGEHVLHEEAVGQQVVAGVAQGVRGERRGAGREPGELPLDRAPKLEDGAAAGAARHEREPLRVHVQPQRRRRRAARARLHRRQRRPRRAH
mmetsp:Transcript_3551/g.10946  ORF Transcript_3551/g.10946 Transcript_3551/m.10946 type:complete len:229 (-) Transcript_3551:122-808(-)